MEKQNISLQSRKAFLKNFSSDFAFDLLYPEFIRKRSACHWTSLDIARQAARFLAADGDVRILDIGSGAGKFSLAAAYYQPGAVYYGIEQRQGLHYYADKVKQILQLENVYFKHGNITQVDLRDYDHFYFYNSFYENLPGTDKIDNTIDYSPSLYDYYNRYLYTQLTLLPAGTRIATFHSLEYEIPPDYHVVGSEQNELLKFWIKV